MGGIGIANGRGMITFENSTINTLDEFAMVGIYHEYNFAVNLLPRLYIDNSEIFTCYFESYCQTVNATDISGQGPAVGIGYIGTTLLWGGAVVPAGGIPVVQCMWDFDETYYGYGWPAMPPGVPVPNFICP